MNRFNLITKLTIIPLITLIPACTNHHSPQQTVRSDNAQGHSAPTVATIKANQDVIQQLPFDNKQDFIDAKRGLIASMDLLIAQNSSGEAVWDMSRYNFINYQGVDGQAPASVNPSLWRQANLNNIHGLFKVREGIYQLRGFDLANMTLIEGKTGWIVVDPLTAKETSKVAFNFAQQYLGKKPILSLIHI